MSMSTYNVTAVDLADGRETTEEVEADSRDNALAQVQARGLTVVDVKEVKSTGLRGNIVLFKSRVKPAEVAVFARQFATMIKAGMPMLRSLSVMTRQASSPGFKSVLQALTNAVESGSSLSAAMEEHPTVFPPLMVSMVHSGEIGGYLDEAMKEVAVSLEKDVRLRAKIKSAATYPVVVMCMGVLGTIAMLIFVVPTFTSMFTSMGGQLPLPTRIVVGMSSFMKVAIFPLIGVGIVFSFWWRKNKNTEAVRSLLDPLKLRAPVFGQLVRKIAVARFTRNLSVMLHSGVSIIDALKVVSNTAGNTVIRDAIVNACEKIKSGEQLSDHLGDGGAIPDLVVEMVAVGESTGAMDEMLSKVADFYEEEVSTTTDQLASLMEPILIVVMGVVLGSLVVAMYLPTFMVFNLVK